MDYQYINSEQPFNGVISRYEGLIVIGGLSVFVKKDPTDHLTAR